MERSAFERTVHDRAALGPLAAIAATRSWRLQPETAALREEARTALRLALGAPLEVSMVPCDRRSTPEDWPRAPSLGETIRARHGEALWDALPYGDWDVLRAIVRPFWDGIWTAGWSNMPGFLWRAQSDSAFETLFHYVGFCIAGDENRAATLSPVVALLPRAFPLGATRGDPSIWLVLAG